MSIEHLISQCQRQGISFSLNDNDQLNLHAKVQPCAELVAELKQRKAELITYLQQHKLRQLENSLSQSIDTSPLSFSKGEVSFQQQRMWLIDTLRDGAIEYHLARSFTMKGSLDLAAFQTALTHVIEQNEILKTVYNKQGSTLFQKILPHFELPLSLVDHTTQLALTNKDTTQKIKQFIEKPFNLSCELPVRLCLQTYSPTHHELTITIHHIAADGWSIALFCQQVALHYAAQVKQIAVPPKHNTLRYIDFARWQRDILNEQNLSLLCQWWQKTLADCQPNVTFALDYPRAQQTAVSAGLYISHIDSPLNDKINRFAKRLGTTPFTIIYGAFSILLAFHSNETDTLIGTPVANREHEQTSELIGFVANTVLLRHKVDYAQSFNDCIAKLKHIMGDAFAHSQLPFEVLLDSLDVPRHPNQPPLINVFLAMHNMKAIVPELQGLDITPSSHQHRLAKFDLTLDIYAQSDGLTLEWEYAAELFEPESIERLAESFEHLLEQLIAHSKSSMQSLHFLPDNQLEQLMSYGHGCVRDYSYLNTLPAALGAVFCNAHDGIATEDAHSALDYHQLAQLVEQYSQAILAQKLANNSIIGVCCARSNHMLAMMIAIWNSGHAYLPLDPNYPQARLVYMLEDTNAPLLLCDKENYHFACQLHKNVLSCDTLRAIDSYTFAKVKPQHPAYIIYTSGSTGKPKGVLISHASLLNFVASMTDTLNLNAQTRALALTSISFDIHILELFAPLLSQGYVYIATSEQSKDPQQLQQVITEQQLNLVQATPTTWNMLHRYQVRLNPNTQALSGGEPLNTELLDYFFSQPTMLWNMYGPTETTVWSSVARLSHTDNIHLGKPIDNTQFYIVNSQNQLLPKGTAGELLIAGEGLALDYHNRDDETQLKFIQLSLPTNEVVRAYKTGDLVKLNHQGQLICLGRIDQQIKLHGFRIEISEIESVLMQHEAVQAVAVVLNKVGQLVAFVVSDTYSDQLVTQLNTLLNKHLPAYMRPQHILEVDSLPKTPNDKIDRNKLAAHALSTQSQPKSAQQLHAYSQEIVALWQKHLQKSDIDPHTSFFDQGGNSIQFIDLLSSVTHVTGKSLVIKTLLADPTLAHMHALLNQSKPTMRCEIDLTQPISHHASWQHDAIYLPSLPNRKLFLSFGGKHNLWLVNHTIVLNDSDEQLGFELIRHAVFILLAHHPALRTGFEPDSYKEYIDDLESLTRRQICFDLSELSEHSDICGFIEQEVLSMRLNSGLVRLFYIKREQRVFLTLSLHHAVFDGFSMSVITRNFTRIVKALVTKSHSVSLSVDNYVTFVREFARYFQRPLHANNQSNWQADLDFWNHSAQLQAPRMFNEQRALAANIPCNLQSQRSAIPAHITQRIASLCADNPNIQQSDIHTAAIARALQQTFSLENISLELSQFNRFNKEIEVDTNMSVGYLVSRVVISIDTETLKSQHQTASFIAQFLKEAPHNAIGYHALEALNQDPQLQALLQPIHTPDFSYNYQGELNANAQSELIATSLNEQEMALKQAIPDVQNDHDLSSPHSMYLSTYFENAQQHLYVGCSKQLIEKQKVTELIENYIKNLEGITR